MKKLFIYGFLFLIILIAAYLIKNQRDTIKNQRDAIAQLKERVYRDSMVLSNLNGIHVNTNIHYDLSGGNTVSKEEQLKWYNKGTKAANLDTAKSYEDMQKAK